jgi:hypothetical protein
MCFVNPINCIRSHREGNPVGGCNEDVESFNGKFRDELLSGEIF